MMTDRPCTEPCHDNDGCACRAAAAVGYTTDHDWGDECDPGDEYDPAELEFARRALREALARVWRNGAEVWP